MASAILLVGLVALGSLIMALTLSSSTQNAVVYLYNLINTSQNNSYPLEVNGHLAYLQQSILTVSQQVNLTSQDNLRRINNLTESDKNLLNRIVADEGRISNLTDYISRLNFTCTNTTIIYNMTNGSMDMPAPPVSGIVPQKPGTEWPVPTCRQALISKYGLGSYFDVVSCCELRTYGFADECCACYR
jgi:hypothetical protein